MNTGAYMPMSIWCEPAIRQSLETKMSSGSMPGLPTRFSSVYLTTYSAAPAKYWM